MHTWRKTDSLSIALNYYEGNSFLEPQTNWLSDNGSRNAIAEFPIVYYLIGKLWIIFGHSDWLPKVFCTAFLFSSIIAIGQVVKPFFRSEYLSLLFIILVFSSPVLVFYMDTGIPNPVSYASVLWSGYFVFRYIKDNKAIMLLGFFVFSAIAMLIKITSAIAFLSFAGAGFFYLLFHNRGWWNTYKKQIVFLSSTFICALAVTVFWYQYAIWYNKIHHNAQFFSTTVHPFWKIPFDVRVDRIGSILFDRFPEIGWNVTTIILLVVSLSLTFLKKGESYLKWLISIQIIGVVCYFSLWLWVFDIHNYYMIEVEFFKMTLVFILFYQIRTHYWQKGIFRIFAGLFVLTVILYTTSFTKMMFDAPKVKSEDGIFLSKKTIDRWQWFHWDHSLVLGKIYKHKKDIQDVIPKGDTVFCASDYSPNSHLYTIERIGFSQFNFIGKEPDEKVKELIKRGADYMLRIGNENDEAYFPYLENCVYSVNGINIYDLRSFK